MEAAAALKAEGNELFGKKEWKAAAKKYSAAIGAAKEGEGDGKQQALAIFYRNRAACSIQLQEWQGAISDCTEALEVDSGDFKALFRRAEAYEKAGELAMAFEDLRKVVAGQPKNKSVQRAMERVMKAQKAQEAKTSSEDLVSRMLTIMEDRENADAKKRAAATRNLAVLGQTAGKVEWLLEASGIERMKTVFELPETEEEVQCAVLKAFAVCSKHNSCRQRVYDRIGLDFLVSATAASQKVEVAADAFRVIQQYAGYLHVLYEKERERRYKEKIPDKGPELPVKKVQLIVAAVYKALQKVTLKTPEKPLLAALGVIIEAVPCYQMAISFMDSGFIRLLLQVCSVRTDDAVKTKATLALSSLYEWVGNKKEEQFRNECSDCLMAMLERDADERLPALFALSVVLQAIPAVGDFLVDDPTAMEKVIALAKLAKGEEEQKIIADAILQTAANKKIGGALLAAGFGELKAFYKSPYDSVRVRALAGLSKVGVAGGDKGTRGMSGDSYVNLSKGARSFLGTGTSDRTDCVKADVSDPEVLAEMRGYAVEALAYLACEAEVKEELVDDKQALRGLHETALLDSRVLRIAIVSIYQNICCAFAKPTEEQEQLGKLHKMAGQEVPGMVRHAKDMPEFIERRIGLLVEAGACAALSALSKTKSEQAAEILSRIYLSIVEAHKNYRGIVIQQGGARALKRLSRFGTNDGKQIAQQSLAKCAIVLNPNVAFPGQVGVDCVGILSELTRGESMLATYEATLALTNLMGCSEDCRIEMIRHPRALSDVEMVQIEDDPRLRQAATECLLNLLQSEAYFTMFLPDGKREGRIPIWIGFCGEESLGLARASCGGLAMLTQLPNVCEAVLKEKHGLTILKELAASPDAQLQHRAVCAINHIIQSSKANARAYFESENSVELLTALYQLVGTSKAVKEQVKKALDQLMDMGLVARNV